MRYRSLICALLIWGCGPSVPVEESEGSAADGSSGGAPPVESSTSGELPPPAPGTSSTTSPPATTTGGEDSSESGSSTGDMAAHAPVLWEQTADGRIVSIAVTQDASVWALVDGETVHVEQFSRTGELLNYTAFAEPALPEGAVEAVRDGGDVVLVGEEPIYGFSWTFVDAEGAVLGGVSRIERFRHSATAWVREWPQSHVRLGVAGVDIVGTDDVARFKWTIDGEQIWRFEDADHRAFIDVEGLDSGVLAAMTEDVLITYRPDGVPQWFVDFGSSGSEGDQNHGIVPVADGMVALVRPFESDEGSTDDGALYIFAPTAEIAHYQTYPIPTSTFDLDAEGNSYVQTDEAALAKYSADSELQWIADLPQPTGGALVDVGSSGAVFYAADGILMRIES